jgi:hypothetical protein
MHSFSFFEAEAHYKDTILKAFSTKKYKSQNIVVDEAEPSQHPPKKSREKEKKQRYDEPWGERFKKKKKDKKETGKKKKSRRKNF